MRAGGAPSGLTQQRLAEPLPGDPDAHLDPASEAASVMAQERGAAMAKLPAGEVHSGRSDHVARSRATANFVSVKQ
jgi:hypothetical protein